MKTIMISPTKRAGRRTKNRINEKGPVFTVERELQSGWLLRAAPPHKWGSEVWMGWLPRHEFHVECVGKEFIAKVLSE